MPDYTDGDPSASMYTLHLSPAPAHHHRHSLTHHIIYLSAYSHLLLFMHAAIGVKPMDTAFIIIYAAAVAVAIAVVQMLDALAHTTVQCNSLHFAFGAFASQ